MLRPRRLRASIRSTIGFVASNPHWKSLKSLNLSRCDSTNFAISVEHRPKISLQMRMLNNDTQSVPIALSALDTQSPEISIPAFPSAQAYPNREPIQREHFAIRLNRQDGLESTLALVASSGTLQVIASCVFCAPKGPGL